MAYVSHFQTLQCYGSVLISSESHTILSHYTDARRDEPFIDKWFGADGNKRMQYDTFQKFLVQLHGIFDGMEFDMLDVKGKGYISGLELARSLVAPGPVTMIDALLDRVCSFV